MAFLVATSPAAALADDLFEIQVFHARVNEPGEFGAELHSNYVAAGAAHRDPPEVSPEHTLYEMLEPSLGVSPGWEVGAHLQAAIGPDGPTWGGTKLRTLALIPVPEGSAFKFAVNVEGGYVPPRYEPGRWGVELRPIAEWHGGSFDVDVNPVLAVEAEGPHAGVPRFEPAAAVRYTLMDTVDLGLEYYASLGALDSVPPISRQAQYVFETVEVRRWPTWILRAGLGEGLTPESNGIVVTTLFGHFY